MASGILNLLGEVSGAISLLDRLMDDGKRKSNPRMRGVDLLDAEDLEKRYGDRALSIAYGLKVSATTSKARNHWGRIVKVLEMRRKNPSGRKHPATYELVQNLRAAAQAYDAQDGFGSMATSAFTLANKGVSRGWWTDAEFRRVRYAIDNAGEMTMHKNPRGRSTRSVNRASQITRKAPSKRLVKRRRKTLTAPPGFFANPRGRSKGSVNRPSQITRKAPTKRLVKRRRKTLTAPRGYFANPVADWIKVRQSGADIAAFRSFARARNFAQDLADRTGRQVEIKRD